MEERAGERRPRVGDPKPQPRKRASSPLPSPPAAGREGEVATNRNTASAFPPPSPPMEGRGEEAVNLTSEVIPPDLMMPEASQSLAGG